MSDDEYCAATDAIRSYYEAHKVIRERKISSGEIIADKVSTSRFQPPPYDAAINAMRRAPSDV